MKTKDGGEGEGGLINFPPLKRGGLFERGGLNRGFTVCNKLSSIKEMYMYLDLFSEETPEVQFLQMTTSGKRPLS